MIWFAAAWANPSQPPRVLLEIPLGKTVHVNLCRMPRHWSITDTNIVEAPLLGSLNERMTLSGLQIGTTDILVSYGDGTLAFIDVSVQRDLGPLNRSIGQLVGRAPDATQPALSLCDKLPAG